MRFDHPIRILVAGMISCLVVAISTSRSAEPPLVRGVEAQPLNAQVRRVVQALEQLGTPLDAERRGALEEALQAAEAEEAIVGVQRALDPLCLAVVNINPESRVSVAAGSAEPTLHENGWRVFLVKVHNEAGVTAALRVQSPNAAPMVKRSTNSPEPEQTITAADVNDRWMDVSLYDRQPLNESLSGLAVEYRILELYSRDEGQREGNLMFDVGQGTQDLAHRNEINILFECAPSVDVELTVLDHDGTPTTGQFVFRDARGRVYPAMSRRLEPDFFFHEQIYRHSGETVTLPAGAYDVTYTRGPEYVIARRRITVPQSEQHREEFQLQRWIHLAERGWISGDHHIHAAGCAHYESPTEGVTPEAMMRHILGEDLNVGCVLSWGPCWYAQKQFFDGGVHELSQDQYLMRYDVEVSGFPSSHAGHLTLLRLTEDDYPGATRIEEWPSWDLPVLKWAKEQGGIVGFAHSGWGLALPDDDLPNYNMPPFDGIGANEYVVDVTHDAVDFISTVDTPAVWELNIWYHTLNCGFDCRISGETDFPCIYGERVGLGRSYVKLPAGEPVDFDAWALGVKDGRSYVSDGLSHLVEFTVGGLGVGEPGEGDRASVLAAEKGKPLSVKLQAAALLDEEPREDIRRRPLEQKPYWHVERARIGDGRKVPVELVVNGEAVARKEITADGSVHEVAFEFTPEKSSWVAVRIFPSSHTNPVFIEVDGQPIRASRASAEWCLKAVDQCWTKKSPNIRAEERPAAEEAYAHARSIYRQILQQSE